MERLKSSGRRHPDDEDKTIETCPACGKSSSMPPKGLHSENHIVCPFCETEMVFIYKVKLTKNQLKKQRRRDKKK